MLSEKQLMKRACEELINVFGKEYLQKNYERTLKAQGLCDADTFMLFVGIKDHEDLPDRKVSEKGWVVYGKVLLDAHSGELKEIEYALE